MSDKNEKEEDFRSKLTDAYKTFDAELEETKAKDKKKKQEILEKGIEEIEKKSMKELGFSKILATKILDIRQRAGMTQTIGTAGKVKAPILFGRDEFKQKLVRELLVIGTEELADIGSAITIANLIDYFRDLYSYNNLST